MGRKPNNPNSINSTQPAAPVVQPVDPNQLIIPQTTVALNKQIEANEQNINSMTNKIESEIAQSSVSITQSSPLQNIPINVPQSLKAITDDFSRPKVQPINVPQTGATQILVGQDVTNKRFKRNSDGLIEGVAYKYLEDGRIDWRAMIKPEHLVVFKEKREEVEKKYGKTISELDLTTVDDKYLLILLIGLKELASKRGFYSVLPHVDEANSQRCVVTTTIKWIPNFETNFEYVEFGDVGAASLENTYSFGQRYLEACASNRAFARAVRNFLGINIVAYDEIGGFNKDGNGNIDNDDKSTSSLSSGYKPHNLLEQKVDSKGLNFAKFRDAVVLKYKNEIKSDPTKWESYISIPPTDIYVLLGILEKSKN